MTARGKSDFTDRLNINSAVNDWGLASGQQLPMEEFRRLIADLIDSYLNSTALTDGQVPMKSAVDGTAAPSGLFSESNILRAPMNFTLEAGGTRINDLLEINQLSSFLAITNRAVLAAGEDTQFAVVDYRIQNDGVSFRPRVFERTEAENAFVATSDNTQSIVINQATPLIFNYTTTLDAQTNAFRFQVGTALVNARLRVTDTATGVAVRYIPNQAAWITGTGGLDFTTGTQDFSFERSQLVTFSNEQYTVEVRATSGAVLGSATDYPAITFMLQRIQATDISYQRDVQEQPFKRGVLAATTANITLSGAQTIDGVSIGNNDRVLVKDQTDASENGIYVAADPGAWSRATDADTSAKVPSGIFVPVSEGTTDGDTLWFLETNDPITLGTTDLTFREFSGTMTTFEAPAITSLSISGLTDPTPPVGTALGGSRTLTFAVTNTENIQGDLQFFWDDVSIAMGITATAGTAVVTIPATTTVAGVTHTGRLQGTNTRGDAFSRSVTFRSAQDQEQGYYGVLATDTFASVDVATLTAFDVTQSGTVFNISQINIPAGHFVGILLPEDRELTSLTNPADIDPNADILADFTETVAARVISSTNYTSYVEQNGASFAGVLSLRGVTE